MNCSVRARQCAMPTVDQLMSSEPASLQKLLEKRAVKVGRPAWKAERGRKYHGIRAPPSPPKLTVDKHSKSV